MQDQPYDAENDIDHDDEKPTIVVLEPGDLSAEDVKKIEEKCKNHVYNFIKYSGLPLGPFWETGLFFCLKSLKVHFLNHLVAQIHFFRHLTCLNLKFYQFATICPRFKKKLNTALISAFTFLFTNANFSSSNRFQPNKFTCLPITLFFLLV